MPASALPTVTVRPARLDLSPQGIQTVLRALTAYRDIARHIALDNSESVATRREAREDAQRIELILRAVDPR